MRQTMLLCWPVLCQGALHAPSQHTLLLFAPASQSMYTLQVVCAPFMLRVIAQTVASTGGE